MAAKSEPIFRSVRSLGCRLAVDVVLAAKWDGNGWTIGKRVLRFGIGESGFGTLARANACGTPEERAAGQ